MTTSSRPDTSPPAPTPRTDALVQIIEGGNEYASLQGLLALARQLERELAEAKAQAAELDASYPVRMTQDEYETLQAYRADAILGLKPEAPVPSTAAPSAKVIALANMYKPSPGFENTETHTAIMAMEILRLASAPSHVAAPSDLVKRLNHLWLQATDFAEGETLREAAAALSAIAPNTYKDLWERFVSLQTGDATLLVKDAARYRWMRNAMLGKLLPWFDTTDTSDVGLDAAVDAAMDGTTKEKP